MRTPPLDAHAHIDASIGASELSRLGARVFAMTRSLAEFESVSKRRDLDVVWGLGLHPGLVRNQKAYTEVRFRELIRSTPLVGEIGLDGKSRVALDLQLANLRSILSVVQEHPRIVSIHSYDATTEVIRELSRQPIRGAVLHWWLGTPGLTEEAVRLGCYFSVSPAMSKETDVLNAIPKSRLLLETDHPSGDRFGPQPRRPGNTSEVVRRLGAVHGLNAEEMQQLTWRNLARLADETGTADMFGPGWRVLMDRSRRL